MVGVVIPCFKVEKHILSVLDQIGSEVDRIYVVDDACPYGSGQLVKKHCTDSRIKVIFNEVNLGVGGAVMAGYRSAMEDGCDMVVKLDGDGQMDPAYISTLIDPILRGDADYTKGNRFWDFEHLKSMPTLRLLGNSGLTFATKLMSGYWTIFDPTNGFTAIHIEALKRLSLNKIAKRYFFESDMLFRLSTIRAVVVDVPMKAHYGAEQSNLRISKVLFEFPPKILIRFCKRLNYKYVIRDLNLGSIYLFGGLFFVGAGTAYGGYQWIRNFLEDSYAPSGVVMLAALPIILGFQLLLSFISYDLFSEPKVPLQKVFKYAVVRSLKVKRYGH